MSDAPKATKNAETITNHRFVRYAKRFENYLASEVDMTRSPAEKMDNEWYETVGLSAAEVCHTACISSWVPEPRAVLDLPCGHGRVLRHLVKLFPEATFDACDLDRDGVAFCAKQFGATPVASHENPAKVVFPRLYDLIWVGSLFTHLRREATFAWLRRLTEQLTTPGIVVATFHGRYSAMRGAELGYIDAPRWRLITDAYETTGYGYASYQSHRHDEFIGNDYGVSASSPEVVIAEATKIPGVRVLGYMEKGWAGHQDVLVLAKPSIET